MLRKDDPNIFHSKHRTPAEQEAGAIEGLKRMNELFALEHSDPTPCPPVEEDWRWVPHDSTYSRKSVGLLGVKAPS